MVAPCDKYQGLVVGPDGQTVADPYGMIATLGDYEEWRAVASNLIARAVAELEREFAETGALDEADAAPVADLETRWANLGGAIAQSFENFPELSWAGPIVKMVELARDAACQIGIIEARTVAKGGDESDIPEPPPMPPGSGVKGGGKGGGLGLLLLLGLVGLGLSERRGSR